MNYHRRWVRTLNGLMALVLMGVLLSAYYQQYFKHEMPCPLCILQRLAMVGVAMGPVINLIFGIRAAHYGVSMLFAMFGASVSLRQMAMHVCPGFPDFGLPVYGVSLYTWAFLSFAACLFSIGIFLLIHIPEDRARVRMNWFEMFVVGLVIAITFSNLITTYDECGFGPCKDVPWPQENATEAPTVKPIRRYSG
jgi:disulfide bond formation protein DsbB